MVSLPENAAPTAKSKVNLKRAIALLITEIGSICNENVFKLKIRKVSILLFTILNFFFYSGFMVKGIFFVIFRGFLP
jgi:hypothetical protein